MNKLRSRIGLENRWRKLNDKMGPAAALVFLFICLCMLHAISAGHYVDFNPINGTFQNFNPVRRLLAGQIPYKDFQDYLGMGHLYAGALCTFLLGGDYQASLIAFSLLTFLGVAMCSLAIGNAVLGNGKASLAITDLFLLLLLIQPVFIDASEGWAYEIADALKSALDPGSSARFVRGMILPIDCFAIEYGCKMVERIYKCNDEAVKYKDAVIVVGMAILAGFSFLWSNDYGISSWVCLSIMTFVILLARKRKVWMALVGIVIELVLSLIWLFLSIEIFTFGHFQEWFQATFGTGSYQSWYFNPQKSYSYYIYDVDFHYLMLIQAFLCIIYLLKIFKASGRKEAIMRYGIPAFANMACFCAANEYKLLSGGGLREVAFSVLFLTILYEICRILRTSSVAGRAREGMKTALLVVGCAWTVSTLKDEAVFWKLTEKEGEYVEELGGNMTERSSDLRDAMAFLDGEGFFATYASAQEVMAGIYQPSGVDYIIHVLGDHEREAYLESFQKGDFRYAATIKESLTEWETWAQRANWFFYRELYREWHPVYTNSYEVYWERNGERDRNVLAGAQDIMVEMVDESTCVISIQTEEQIDGVADVFIDYAVRKKDKQSANLLFQTMLHTENTGTNFTGSSFHESNYLRNEGAEYIPITIVDGYGEVTLTSCPVEGTWLEVSNVSCSEIFTVPFDYVEVQKVIDYGEVAAIAVEPGEKAGKILEGIKGVVIGGEVYGVAAVRSEDDHVYVVIQTDKRFSDTDRELMIKGNMIKVSR